MTKYSIALSFSGSERKFAESIANKLKENDVKVFYDKFAQHDLWGKDLYETLRTVYIKECRYVVLLVSNTYLESMWPVFERKQIIDRLAHEHGQDCILPVRVDGCSKEIPGLSRGLGYINAKSTQSALISNLILRKLNQKDYEINSSDAYLNALELLKTRKHGYLQYNRILTSMNEIKADFPKIIGGDLLQFLGHQFFWKREENGPLTLYAKDESDKNSQLCEICYFDAPESWIGIGQFRIHWLRSRNRKDKYSIRVLIFLYISSPKTDEFDNLVDKIDFTNNELSIFLACLYLDETNSEQFNLEAENKYQSIR
jgi:hypothetical protein